MPVIDAILITFYDDLDLVKNRLIQLRELNADVNIYGLYSGPIDDILELKDFFGNLLDEVFITHEHSGNWRWLHLDRVVLNWFEKYGRYLKWDNILCQHSDQLTLESYSVLFKDLKKDEIYVSGTRTLTQEIEKWWDWTRGTHRANFDNFIDTLKTDFNYTGEIYCSIFALEIFPRSFLEKYAKLRQRNIGVSEYSVPTLAKALNIPIYSKELGAYWHDTEIDQSAINGVHHNISNSFIYRELLKKDGLRIFHPYVKKWDQPIATIADSHDFEIMNYFSPILKDQIKFINKMKTNSGNSVYHLIGLKDYLLKIYSFEHLKLNNVSDYLFMHTQIPVPKTIYSSESYRGKDTPVLVQDYISGATLDSYFNLDENDIFGLFRQLKSYLEELHFIDAKVASDIWIPNDFDERQKLPWVPYINFIIETLLTDLYLLPLELNIKEKITNTFIELANYLNKEKWTNLSPLHGDINPKNVLVRKDSTRLVINRLLDFERSRIGDSVWDFVYFYGMLVFENAELAELWKCKICKDVLSEKSTIWNYYEILFFVWSMHDAYTNRNKNSNLESLSSECLKSRQALLNLFTK